MKFFLFASVSVSLALIAQGAQACTRYDEGLGAGDKWEEKGYIQYDQPVALGSSYHTTATINGQAVQFSTYMNGANTRSEALKIKSNAVTPGERQGWGQFKFEFNWTIDGVVYSESRWLQSDDSCTMSGAPSMNNAGLPFQYSQLNKVTIHHRL